MATEWIAGRKPVEEALQAKHALRKIVISDQVKETSITPILRLAKQRGITVEHVARKQLDHWADGVLHQGVMAVVEPLSYASLEDLFAVAKSKAEAPFFIILDHIEDPHNLGSIIRTADAAGAHGVIIPKKRAAGLTPAVVKASAGAVHYMRVVRVANLAQTIEVLKSEGLWIFGTDAGADQDYRLADYAGPLALVIGNEGKGLSRLVHEKCDFTIKLPLSGHLNSLNASVAAGLSMFEVFRQRYPVQQSLPQSSRERVEWKKS